MKIYNRLVALAASTTLLAAGLIGVGAATPAQAASCSVTVSNWSAYNVSCSQARHFNIISNTTYKYAPWVAKQRTSSQNMCWAYMTHKGAQVKV